MAFHPQSVRTVGGAVLASLLVACSLAGPGPTGRHLSSQQAATMPASPAAAPSEKPQVADRLEAIIERLNLSADQITSIQTLIQQQPKIDEQAIKARVAQIRELLAAPQVDVAALANHIAQDRAGIHRRVAAMIDVITGIRNILTPEQRQLLASLPAPPAMQVPSDLASDLHLSEQQKAALAALRPTLADSGLQSAVHQFMATGDRDALKTAIDTAIEKLPAAADVAGTLASLSQDQRQKLIAIASETLAEGRQAAMAPDESSQPQASAQAGINQSPSSQASPAAGPSGS